MNSFPIWTPCTPFPVLFPYLKPPVQSCVEVARENILSYSWSQGRAFRLSLLYVKIVVDLFTRFPL